MASDKVQQPAGNPIFEVGSSAAVDNPIRVGVIGLGRIGWCHHSQAIFGHGGFELAAVCDLEADRREEAKAKSGCATYDRFQDLVADPNVELVIVATQSIDHEPMAIAASNAGKHVLVEKPSAQSAAGIRRMMAAAEAAGKLLTMHHNYRLNPEYLYVREVIESGVLGRIFRIKRREQGFGRRNDWQTLRKYGGGMTGNWGIHLVDAGLQLLGSDVSDVWGHVQQIFNPGDAEDDIKAVVRGTNGVVLDIDMTSACAVPEPRWVVCGTHGTLWMEGNQGHLRFFDPAELPDLPVNDLHLALNRAYGVQPGPDNVPWQDRVEDFKPQGTYPSYMDNLYAAIREGGTLLVEPSSALRTYEVLDAIRRGSPFAPAD